jgi:hypothetical protein
MQHQQLLHFVGAGKRSNESALAKLRELVIPAIERHGTIEGQSQVAKNPYGVGGQSRPKAVGPQKRGKTMTKRAKKIRRAGTKPEDNAASELAPPQKIEMPKIDPPPSVEFDMHSSAQWLKHMDPRNAVFLCKAEWSEAPHHERMESYYLQQGGTHWNLWIEQYDDNWGKWEKPFVIARCPCIGLTDRDAAMTLLSAVLSEEQRRYDSDWGRFDITDTGLLSMEELDTVADAVWGEGENNEG